MKTNKGIKCSVNTFVVSAVTVRNGKADTITFEMQERNASEAKRIAAETFGVKKTQVIVSIELVKQNFTIYDSFEHLISTLDAQGIMYSVSE